MKTSNIVKYGIVIVVLVIAIVSCKKQDHYYKDFLKGGEIIYVGKADSILFQPGKNRAKLSFAISDPSISVMKIYWDDYQDSMVVDVMRKKSIDTIEVVIPALQERFYSFEIYSYDDAGNRSIKSLAEGQVYGDNYANSIFTRAISDVFFEDDQATISWYNAHKNEIRSEVRYTDKEGEEHTLSVLPSEGSTVLENVALGSSFEYRTSYLPDTLAIDTFYTAFSSKEILLIEKELDYSKFAVHRLANDPADYNTNRIHFLWNGNIEDMGSGSGGWYRTANNSGVPNQVTIDMGVRAKLTRFTLWQRGIVKEQALLYANANVQKFELWGSNAPTPDGNYDSWVKLMEGEILKPSGLSAGEPLTSEDLAVAAAGHEFNVPLEAPAVRYLRIRVMGTFEPNPHFFLSNIGVFGQSYIQ